MKANLVKNLIRGTRSPTSLAEYLGVGVTTVYNRFLADEIPDTYIQKIIEWIEINNDTGLYTCDKLLKLKKV